ncbi:phosphoglucosamine mutase [Candidatus Thorarchaeota archaeon]|nr:MAG: phosphoglucosamine mutase [Candidatus Thorarchaeota archaeon]
MKPVTRMSDRLFGTTGVRKVYGEEISLDMALELGKALGTYLKKGNVLLARDARTTGAMVADAFSAGLLSTGINVHRAGVIPTPTLAFLTRHLRMDTGVMITASHNPPEYTGIKFWKSDSMGYTQDMETELEEIYQSHDFNSVGWDDLGEETSLDSPEWIHIQEIVKRTNVDAIRQRDFRVVVDPGNGAACVFTPYLMREIGCRVTSINGQLDGHFPGRESEPDEDTLGDLIKMVKSSGADLGIAHDGDADRVVFVTEQGDVIRGDRTIALLAREFLQRKKGGVVVTTVDSSKVLDETVKASGGQTIRTPVGDIQVAVKMKEKDALLGGEACGVFIHPDFHLAPEPFLTSCRILEMMASRGKAFGELISEIPVYPLKKTKLKCPDAKKRVVMGRLAETLPDEMDDVTDVLTVDGLGISLRDGWVLVRPSGTEPVIRITCEAQSEERAQSILEDAKEVVQKAIDEVRE